MVWDVRKGRAGYHQTSFGPVSLTGIAAGPVREKLRPVATTRRLRWGRYLRHSSWLCGSACEQFALPGPVQRQIEFGQTRPGQRDGLPALQDRVDQLRAQEGETNKPADVAPGDAVTLGQRLQRRRPAGDQFVKPRAPAAIALISTGSRRALWFG